MSGTAALAATAGILSGLGALESYRHKRALRQIPTRIHVNGTRGKSSVTRLIAAGLRAGELRTCAKTTGTLARMIMPDGQEFPIYRPSKPNVLEQLRIVRTAADQGAQVLVIECMALQPSLQSLSEEKLVRANHAVITNARADHLDVMGPEEPDVAKALAGMIPPGGNLYTAERRHLDIFREACADRGTNLIAITEEDIAKITAEDLAGFRYIEHAENLAVALKVCADLGVAKEVALAGMKSASPDPGVLTDHALEFFGRHIRFVNAFAANDPESTERIWSMVSSQHAHLQRRIAVVNCRADRADRSRQLAEQATRWEGVDHYLLIGTGTYIFGKRAVLYDVEPSRITYAEDRRIEEIFELILELAGRSALVIGVANIGGQGLELARYFKNRSATALEEVS